MADDIVPKRRPPRSSSFQQEVPSPSASPLVTTLRPDTPSYKLEVSKLLNSSLLLKAMFQIGAGKENFVECFYSLLASALLRKEGIVGGLVETEKEKYPLLIIPPFQLSLSQRFARLTRRRFSFARTPHSLV
jgi:hypothetical protein